MNIQLWRKKDAGPDPDLDMKSYQRKLALHRLKNAALAGIVIAAVVIAYFGIRIYNQNKIYSTYEVTKSFERTDTMTTQYTEFLGYVLKYGQDGISCVDSNNQLVWSQSYTMQHPVIQVCGKSVAVAEENGTTVLIFDETGFQGEVKTTLPISQISVSNQGVLAALLEDADLMRLNLYDKSGTELVSAKFELQDAGYPIRMSLSADATKLAVSFLQVQDGGINSCLAFYNFDSVGENYEDHLVAAKTVSGIVMPSVHYLDSTHCAAVGTDELLIYEGQQIPELSCEIPVDREIESVFYSEEYVGLILPGEEERYALQVYNMRGNLLFDTEFDLDYTTLKFSGDNILIYNENDYLIINESGKVIFSGSFEESVSNLYTLSGNDRLVVMHASRTDHIRLR